jgi:DNA gyrase inhibitor GyrI
MCSFIVRRKNMSKQDVRIVHLEPMRVASAHGYGESPEPIAWSKILAYARDKGLLENREAVRFFGFNNPDPSPGTPNYGYEQWITVGPDAEPEGDIEIKEIPGGLYAVARCEGLHIIGKVWKALVNWWEESDYKRGQHQCLEECHTPPVEGEIALEDHVFDLYLPIVE